MTLVSLINRFVSVSSETHERHFYQERYTARNLDRRLANHDITYRLFHELVPYLFFCEVRSIWDQRKSSRIKVYFNPGWKSFPPRRGPGTSQQVWNFKWEPIKNNFEIEVLQAVKVENPNLGTKIQIWVHQMNQVDFAQKNWTRYQNTGFWDEWVRKCIKFLIWPRCGP